MDNIKSTKGNSRIKVVICDDDPVMLEHEGLICRQALSGFDAEIFAAPDYNSLLDGVEGCAIDSFMRFVGGE